jgi:alpha-N-arabinofuranosidase
METTDITLHSDFQIAPVDRRLFGGFLEHWGRAIYQGVYQPDSIHADEDGFRKDVLEALRRMRLSVMRYPGGNFASGYHWMDGIGPQSQRPTRCDMAWSSIEPNQFGTDEFIKLARKMDWQPMLAANLGTGTPEEARNWVEYCNNPTGTYYANLRATNASAQPYNVNLWCLGNEMDGPWQIGHVPADQYALRAQQAAKVMKDTDPSLELVACGTCVDTLPTYLEWDRVVLEYLGDAADYLSLHRYVGNTTGNLTDYLAVSQTVDRQIEEMDAVCRFVQAKKRSKKRIYLSFDEWNVWYRATTPEFTNGRGKFAAHLGEEEYDLADALVVASFLNSLIRHADVVKIANLAQVVNAIAPLLTRGDDLLLQSTYYPFVMFSNRKEGISLKPVVKGPAYISPAYGETRYLDTSAILGEQVLHVFIVNRSLTETAPAVIRFMGGELTGVISAEIVTGAQATVKNTFEAPAQIQSQPFSAINWKAGLPSLELPPLSVVAVTFSCSLAGSF